MPDKMTPEQRHNCMSHIRAKDTKPEILVRKELFRRGFRYRINARRLPGSPDIVLAKYRTVIFVNGCFWHGHEGCSKFVMPSSNVEFWQEKISRNRERDQINNRRLESLAWNVITIWECELSKTAFQATLDRVETEIFASMSKWEAYQTRKRQDRAFALSQSRKRREILAQVESELATQYDTAIHLRKAAEPDIDYSPLDDAVLETD